MFGANEEIGDTLEPEKGIENGPKRKVKLYIIIGVVAVVVIAIVITIVVVTTKGDNNNSKDSQNGEPTDSESEHTDEPDVEPDEFEVNLSTIPLPEDIIIDDGHYLFDGNIFICYKKNSTNDTYFGIISDDGNDFKELYGDEFNVSNKANGIRLIPFRDNKRVYLGDFIFECNDTTKNLSECEKGVLIPVNYPTEVVNNSLTYKTWSEMVVAPDNVHVAWTSLNLACGAVNFIGKFQRNEDSYEIIEPKIISTINFIEKDPDNETILIPKVPRGGEIKQFIEGGNAITLVGTLTDSFVKSVYQSLISEVRYAYSHETGYDETSILSPDEKLGIAMSTRFSPNTSMNILGLMPRPYCSLILANMAQSVYTYAVTGVREGRKGNIGPVLFNKDKSMKNPNYHGIDLHDKDGKYIFCSPISWHPSNLKALWPETDVNKNRRLRKLEISNYTASEYPKIQNTTDNVPYALNMSEFEKIHYEDEMNGIIKGKYSGVIEYYNSGSSPFQSKTVKLNYKNYSDDGQKFYNGEEIYKGGALSGSTFSSNVNLTGIETGQNNFIITFSKDSKLIKDKTEGYATYGGKTIRAENYLE